MLKAYQLKSFLILISILILGTMLLGERTFREFQWWGFFIYALRLVMVLLTGWMINAYVITYDSVRLIGFRRYVLAIAASMLAIFVLDYVLNLILPDNYIERRHVGYETWADVQQHIGAAFFVSLICYIVFYSTHTNTVLQNTKYKNEVLEQSHLRAQLISLQQQISPHFLFNSLSTLKTIAQDQPTKNYVMQLSSVYRYVLNFNERYLTPLKEELSFIKSYVYILNERFEDTLVVNIDIDEANLDLLIPSLSLQLLIENAIKHNTISPEQPLHISIFSADHMRLTVANDFQPKNVKEHGTGMGLKNISERYKLLANRSIDIQNDQRHFSVTIPLLTS